MFPIIAIGAALVGGIAAAAAASSSSSTRPSSDSGSSSEAARAADRPSAGQQSYIVTPVTNGSPSALSAVEAVRRLTV